MMKKSIALLLLFSLVFGTVSCGSDETASNDSGISGTNDEATIPVETSELDQFMADYGGYEFRILTSNATSNTWFTTTLTVMEDEGDVFSSAVYNRNRTAEEKLNITLSETYLDTATIRSSIMAGEDAGDLLLVNSSDCLTMASEGAVLDLHTLPHQDFSAAWWDTNAAEQLSVAEKLYLGVGDFITTANDSTIVTFFNKQLLEDYKMENPYELVKNGEWTLDKMIAMGKQAMKENGDTVYTDQDTYGLLGHQNMLYIYLICGSGEPIVTKDKEDIPAFTFNSERFTSSYLKVLNLIHGNGDGFLYDANVKANTMGLSNNHRVMEIMFPNDQAMFWVECISWAKALRDMDADFGILPCPKNDENQENYSNLNNGSFYAMMVPATATDIDRTSLILEALNAYSTDTVQYAYSEMSIKGKMTRDEESAEMIDLIRNTRTYDIAVTYNLLRMRHNICGMALNNDTGIASYYASMESSMKSTIDDLVTAFTEQ